MPTTSKPAAHAHQRVHVVRVPVRVQRVRALQRRRAAVLIHPAAVEKGQWNTKA